MTPRIEQPSPCPDYPDLLVPLYARYPLGTAIDWHAEAERALCLQGWLKKYLP